MYCIVGQTVPSVSRRRSSSSRRLEVNCDDDALQPPVSNGFIVTAALDSAIQLLTTLKQPKHSVTPSLRQYNDHPDNLNPAAAATRQTITQSLYQSGRADAGIPDPPRAGVKTIRNESRENNEDLRLRTTEFQPHSNAATTPRYPLIVNAGRNYESHTNHDDLTAEVEFGPYDLIDEEPTPVVPRDIKPRSIGHQKSSEKQLEYYPADQVLALKKDGSGGSRTVKEELEAIQRRRAFQLQRKDDSFDKPTSADERIETSEPRRTTTTVTTTTTTTTTLALPRDSVIARHRRRTAGRHVVTSSSSSSRDCMTLSSSSSRDTSPADKSPPETGLSPPVTARRTLRRRKRL